MDKKRIVAEISELVDFQEKTFKEIETKEDEIESFLEQSKAAAKEWSAAIASYPRRYKSIFAGFFKSRRDKALAYTNLLLQVSHFKQAIIKFSKQYDEYSKAMIGFMTGHSKILKECQDLQFSPQAVKAIKVNVHMRLPKHQSALDELVETFRTLKESKEDIEKQVAEMRTEQD